jgi:hypothetical protein
VGADGVTDDLGGAGGNGATGYGITSATPIYAGGGGGYSLVAGAGGTGGGGKGGIIGAPWTLPLAGTPNTGGGGGGGSEGWGGAGIVVIRYAVAA